MQNIKVKGKKLKKGYWTYVKKQIEEISIKKGEDFFNTKTPEVYDELDCIKLSSKFYDISEIKEDKVFLTEAVEFDFEGFVCYEAQLPIVIKRDRRLYELVLKQYENMEKLEKKKTILSRCSKEIQSQYLEEMSKIGVRNIDSSQIVIYVIDELEEKLNSSKNLYLKQLLDYVIFIDMDFEVDGISLWDMMKIKKDNYVELAKYLSSDDIGILSDKEDLDDLKYTIEAIKLEQEVEAYILKQKTMALTLEARATMTELRKNFNSDEEFNSFMGNLEEKE